MRERSVLKCRLRLMDVGSVEEIWLAAGIREHLAGPGAAGRERHTGAGNMQAFMGNCGWQSQRYLLKSLLKSSKSNGFWVV